MPCPNCGAVDRLIIKFGKVGKTSCPAPDGAKDSRVQTYKCTGCHRVRRGKYFGLPEFFDKKGNPLHASPAAVMTPTNPSDPVLLLTTSSDKKEENNVSR